MLNCMQLCIFLIFVDTFCCTPWRPSSLPLSLSPSFAPFSFSVIVQFAATSTLITLPPSSTPATTTKSEWTLLVVLVLFSLHFFTLRSLVIMTSKCWKWVRLFMPLYVRLSVCMCSFVWVYVGGKPNTPALPILAHCSIRCEILLSLNCRAMRRDFLDK